MNTHAEGAATPEDTMIGIAAVLSLALASADPQSAKGSCSDFVDRYRELLVARADADAQASDASRSEAASAEYDAAAIVRLYKSQLVAACEESNRSEYECVTDAGTYASLEGCGVRTLPLVPEEVSLAEARRDAEAQAAGRASPARVLGEWVARGTIPVSPELTRAALESAAPERRDGDSAAPERRDGEAPAPERTDAARYDAAYSTTPAAPATR